MIPIRRYFAALCVLAVTVFSSTADAQSADAFSLESTFRGGEVIVAPQQSVIVDVLLRSTTPNANVPVPLTLTAALTNLALPDRPVIARFTTQITPNVPLPISFVTPDKDGIYEIALNVTERTEARPSLLPRSIGQFPTVFSISVESRRPFVVLGSQVSPRITGDWTLKDTRNISPMYDAPEYRLNGEPARRLLPQLPKITDFPKPAELLRLPRPFNRRDTATSTSEPLIIPLGIDTGVPAPYTHRLLRLPPSSGNVLMQSEQHPDFAALSPAGTGGCTWTLLPIEAEIGKPYLIEIDYPVNVPQTLEVGIVDAAVAYRLEHENGTFHGLLNTAASIHVAEEIVQDAYTETVATHRLFFWATSEQRHLVLVNRQPHREALFRNIRISQVVVPRTQEERLPTLFEGTALRKRIGHILGNDAGMVAPEYALAHVYKKCSQLLDIMSRGGYDGVTLTVLSRHSAFYPQETFNGLEMTFRRFTSEGLTLIPAIEFDMPIPSLERWLQQQPATAAEICIGDPALHHYNLLSPIVQQAMAETVLELVDRFGHHSSFGGVAIVLSPDTYAQLPFALYPPDDYTFTQFQQATAETLGIPFPEEQQSVARLQFLQSNPKVWEAWVRWRAAKVSGFYADLAKQVTAKRGDARFYLLGGAMFNEPGIQLFCAPTLPRNFTALQAIQLLGFDLPLIAQTESLHFLKPVHIADTNHRGSNHSYNGLDFADTAALFSKSGMLTGVQFVHNDNNYFVTTPAHIQSRKRFVRQLAQTDVLMFIDAGVSLPFGQEPALFDLLNTYRRLPPVPFLTFRHLENQPLTIRYHPSPDGMLMYIVNDAPFSVEADFVFTAEPESRITELTGHRMIRHLAGTPTHQGTPTPSRHTWRASLLPYDLLAIQISDANANIESVAVHRPPAVDVALRQRKEELAHRVHAAQGGVQFTGLVNADFESPVFDMHFRNSYGNRTTQTPILLSETEVIIPGWQRYGNSLTAQVDRTVVGKGECSVKITNNSPELGTFLSEPFALPTTGRLDVAMLVGVPADVPSLPISVVLSANHQGQTFYRSASVGETMMPPPANVAPQNGVRWQPVRVSFRLPLDSLEEVRIGVQSSGSGTVWIDDFALYHVSFSPKEVAELLKQLPVAEQRYSSGRVSELMLLLEGYWTQFLFEHVPTPLPVVAVAKAPIAKEIPAPPPTLYQRMQGWFGR